MLPRHVLSLRALSLAGKLRQGCGHFRNDGRPLGGDDLVALRVPAVVAVSGSAAPPACQQRTKMLADLKTDLASGSVVLVPCPWPQVHAAAERLSELYTDIHGHRAMDILHVATAQELGAREFLTFDANQRKLAVAEGLRVPL